MVKSMKREKKDILHSKIILWCFQNPWKIILHKYFGHHVDLNKYDFESMDMSKGLKQRIWARLTKPFRFLMFKKHG